MKHWKPVLSIIMAVMIVLSVMPDMSAAAEERQLRVYLDGRVLHFDVVPVVVKGSTYVPLRAVFEAHGATVEWDGDLRVATATIGEKRIEYPVDGTSIIVDGTAVDLGVAGMVVQGRTLCR